MLMDFPTMVADRKRKTAILEADHSFFSPLSFLALLDRERIRKARNGKRNADKSSDVAFPALSRPVAGFHACHVSLGHLLNE